MPRTPIEHGGKCSGQHAHTTSRYRFFLFGHRVTFHLFHSAPPSPRCRRQLVAQWRSRRHRRRAGKQGAASSAADGGSLLSSPPAKLPTPPPPPPKKTMSSSVCNCWCVTESVNIHLLSVHNQRKRLLNPGRLGALILHFVNSVSGSAFRFFGTQQNRLASPTWST